MRRPSTAGAKAEAVGAEVVTGGAKLALAASSPRGLSVSFARAVCGVSRVWVVTSAVSRKVLSVDAAVSLASVILVLQRGASSSEATLIDGFGLLQSLLGRGDVGVVTS